MRVRTALIAVMAGSLAACGSISANGGPAVGRPSGAGVAAHGPVAGSKTEARTLAVALLSRLRLPAGAHRAGPATAPLPRALRAPTLPVEATTSLDVRQEFSARQPMAVVAAFFGSHIPRGMSWLSRGTTGGPDTMTTDVSYAVRKPQPGIDAAQVSLTVAPSPTGGSLVRADAQVIWFPPRSAAEYIDPARYHVLTIAVTSYGTKVHTVHKVLTSRAAIERVAAELDRSQTQPGGGMIGCPAGRATYRLGFAVSARSHPAVVVSATRWGCTGTAISVGGQAQPALNDEDTLTTIAGQLAGVNPTA